MKVAALALAGFREARRNRVTVVLVAFSVVLILMTTVMLNMTIFTLDRVVTDFGLGVMSILLAVLSIYLSVGVLSREIEKRTIFLIVSRSVRRSEFVLAKLLANVGTVTIMLLAMTGVYLLQLVLLDVRLTATIGWTIVGIWAELVVLNAIGIFFSSFTGQIVAAVSVVGLYFLGHAAPDLYRIGETAKSPALGMVGKALYYVVPNLDRLDYRWAAAHDTAVPAAQVFTAVVAALAWTALFTIGAMVLFERRDFK